MGEQSNQQFVKILILAMILSGAGNTIVYSLQNRSHVTYEGETVKFNHPFMQATTMFIGEGLCFLLFLNYKTKDSYKQELLEAQAKKKKIRVNYLLIAIPASADLMTSTLQYIALNYISPSIYQMLRGGVIIVTAIFSMLFLKKKPTRAEIFGCCLAVFGIMIVGLSAVLFSSSKASDVSMTTQVVAMMLIIISLITNGILFVSEEKLFQIYYMHPFQLVGAEGMWGLFGYLLLLPLLSLIQCPSSLESSCVHHNGHHYFERPDAYFYEVFHSPTLLFLVLLGIFTIALFNIAGVSVTKYMGSVARSIVDVTRTIIVWGVGLVISFTTSNEWENTNWKSILLEFFGFAVLVSANLVYNNIVKLPFLAEKTKVDKSDQSDLLLSLEENTQAM